MDISKLKNKEARLNAMAFSRVMTENNLDSDVGDAFLDLLATAEKLRKLENDHIAEIAGVEPESRAMVSAIEGKISRLQSEINELLSKLEAVGVDSASFSKNRQKFCELSKEFSKKVEKIDESLPESSKIHQISPFLASFNTK